jgi:hypothetical protein
MRPYCCRPIWGPLLPTDRTGELLDEIAIVNSGIHSRAKAAANLGDLDHETDFPAWLQENKDITAAGGIPQEPGQQERIAVQ